MQFFLSLEHRGDCKVIHGPDFNIVLSQGIGRPKERKRDGGMAGQWGSQNVQNVYRLNSFLYGCGSRHPQAVALVASKDH